MLPKFFRAGLNQGKYDGAANRGHHTVGTAFQNRGAAQQIIQVGSYSSGVIFDRKLNVLKHRVLWGGR